MTFLELAEKILKEEGKALTANEIWQLAQTKGYNILLNSQGLTPWATLGAQLYVSAKDNAKTPFAQTDTRPKKFYLKSQKDINLNLDIIQTEPQILKKKKFEYLEKDLHTFLTYYAYYHLRCYTKTINHSQSTKKRVWRMGSSRYGRMLLSSG